ncbi:MAG: hypothetical protein ACI8RA_001561 [Chlamydiales bacterium]|jgi:hypothetical protein
MSSSAINSIPGNHFHAAVRPEAQNNNFSSRYQRIGQVAQKVGKVALPLIEASVYAFAFSRGKFPFILGFANGIFSKRSETTRINEFKRVWHMEKIQNQPLKVGLRVGIVALSVSALALSFCFRHFTLPFAFAVAGSEFAQRFKDLLSYPNPEEEATQ